MLYYAPMLLRFLKYGYEKGWCEKKNNFFEASVVPKSWFGFCVFTLTSIAYGLPYAVTNKSLSAQQSNLTESPLERAETCA